MIAFNLNFNLSVSRLKYIFMAGLWRLEDKLSRGGKVTAKTKIYRFNYSLYLMKNIIYKIMPLSIMIFA